MRVAVAGVASAAGGTVPVLVAAGHEVVDAGAPAEVEPAVLAGALAGCDAVVHLAAEMPVGPAARGPRAWREHDRWRGRGMRRLAAAARLAGVRRVVHQGVSAVYADHGEEWIDEQSPLCVTSATEAASVGEMAVQEFSSSCRTGVVLRLGLVVGDTPLSRWAVQAAADGRPVGLGDPQGFVHLVHSDDVGPAVLAALTAPSGTYNVGAVPVRRHEVATACARAAGRRSASFFGPLRTRLAGPRLEPFARSLRVGSGLFSATTGWSPRHDTFAEAWFDATPARSVAWR